MTEADKALNMSRAELQNLADEDLARMILNGSREAFGIFYERHASKAVACLWANRVPRSDADDLLHNSFMAFNHKLNQCNDLKRVTGWGRRLLQHDREDYRKGKSRHDARELPTGLLVDPEDKKARLPIDKLNAEQMGRLREAIEALPQEQKVALVAKHVHKREYAEIAEELGEQIGTITQRVFRAKKSIRKYFAVRGWRSPIGGKRPHE